MTIIVTMDMIPIKSRYPKASPATRRYRLLRDQFLALLATATALRLENEKLKAKIKKARNK